MQTIVEPQSPAANIVPGGNASPPTGDGSSARPYARVQQHLSAEVLLRAELLSNKLEAWRAAGMQHDLKQHPRLAMQLAGVSRLIDAALAIPRAR